MNKSLTAAIALLGVILLATLGYLVFQNQKLAKQIAPSPQNSPYVQNTPIEAQIPSSEPAKKLTLKEIETQIVSSLNSKNYQALAGYMTQPKVNFSLMSTECCEPMTPDETIDQMDYISGGEPFNFDQQSTVIQNLKAKNPQLVQSFIGLSSKGEQLAAFTLDAENKISAVQLSVSYKLYTQ